MKIIYQHKMFFLVIFVLSFVTCGNLCFSAEQEVAAIFDKKVMQLEETWKAGNTNEYFLKARDIAGDIKVNSMTNNLNEVSAKLFDNLFSKEAKISEVGVNDLSTMNELAWCLVSNEKISVEERRINVLLLSRYLGKIRKEIVPNFKPKPVVGHVHPPQGTPRSFPGMSPKLITNLVLRAQYEAAILENKENAIVNKRQRELKGMEGGALKARIIDYIIKTFNAGDISSPLFIECINSAKLNDQEKEEVLNRVGVQSGRNK